MTVHRSWWSRWKGKPMNGSIQLREETNFANSFDGSECRSLERKRHIPQRNMPSSWTAHPEHLLRCPASCAFHVSVSKYCWSFYVFLWHDEDFVCKNWRLLEFWRIFACGNFGEANRGGARVMNERWRTECRGGQRRRRTNFGSVCWWSYHCDGSLISAQLSVRLEIGITSTSNFN